MLSGGPRAKPQRLKPTRLLALYLTAGSRALPETFMGSIQGRSDPRQNNGKCYL
jgi:hypothetical protein